MRLDPEARDILTDAIEEAHRGCAGTGLASRVIASKVVAKVRDAERFGLPWVAPFLDDLAVVGAMKLCADWRRTKQDRARTERGAEVPVPGYAATVTADGATVQMRFDGLDLKAIKAHKERLETTRNTLSAEVQLLANLIRVMEADPDIETAGEALAQIMDRAA